MIPVWASSNGMGDISTECNAAKPLAANRLLLNINRFSVSVVAADVDSTRASSGTNAITGNVSVTGEHIDIVAEGLEIVGDAIA